MSYSKKVKGEITNKKNRSSKEKMSELYALITSKGKEEKNYISIKSENIISSKELYNLIKELTNLRITIKYTISKQLGEHKIYEINIPKQSEYFKLIKEFEKYTEDFILKEKEIYKGFIKGVFMNCGYIKDPNKEYALDFFVSHSEISQKLYNILKNKGKKVFITPKKNSNVIYIRNSEDIMDILITCDAINSFFEYEEVTIIKNIKNKTIREINWEIANETKTLNAASKHLKIIKYLGKHVGLNNLSPVLEEVAFIRMNNPESSLSELASIIGISKSGVKNRLKRLEKIYLELLDKDK